jgi:hypothetical protein
MKDDRAHAQTLLRDLGLINAQTARELGPLPPGGVPVEAKRKPLLPKPALLPPAPSMTTHTAHSDEDSDMDWTRIATTATLIAAASLSACAADQGAQTHAVTPPQAQVESAAVTVQAPPAQTPAKEDQTDQAAGGPTLPASELRERILALMGSFQSLKDLERLQVERVVQMTLTKRPTMEDGYQVFGKTSEGWVYRIGVSRLSRMEDPPTILIDLDDGVEPWTDQEPMYCTLDFESMAKELVAIGYERAEDSVRLKGDTTWWFEKPTSPEGTSIAVGAGLYSLTKDNGEQLVCIRSLRIGGNTRHG